MIRVGLVGAGLHSLAHMDGYGTSPTVTVAAVCDPVPGRADEFAARFGIPHVFADMAEMIGSGEIDLVDLVTPPLSHLELVGQALKSGAVDIICEKPLAIDPEEARQMAAMAAAGTRKGFTSFQRRFDPVLVHLRDLLRDGYAGDIVLSTASVIVNWANLKAPSQAGGYRQWLDKASTGGGFISGSLPHYMDLIRYLYGEITHLVSHSGTAGPDPVPDDDLDQPDDTVVVGGTLASGGLFNLAATWSAAEPTNERWEIVGSKRTLQIHPDGRLYVKTASGFDEIVPPHTPAMDRPNLINRGFGFGNAGPGFGALVTDVAAHLETGSPSACATFHDGLRSAEAVARIAGTTRSAARI